MYACAWVDGSELMPACGGIHPFDTIDEVERVKRQMPDTIEWSAPWPETIKLVSMISVECRVVQQIRVAPRKIGGLNDLGSEVCFGHRAALSRLGVPWGKSRRRLGTPTERRRDKLTKASINHVVRRKPRPPHPSPHPVPRRPFLRLHVEKTRLFSRFAPPRHPSSTILYWRRL